MPGGVADKGARHRQIQASHPALAISIHSTGHWDREDPITGLANRLRQARVLPSEQQHVSLQELKGAEAVSTVPAAAMVAAAGGTVTVLVSVAPEASTVHASRGCHGWPIVQLWSSPPAHCGSISGPMVASSFGRFPSRDTV